MHDQTCGCSKYVTSEDLVTYITVCIVLGFYAAFFIRALPECN